MRLDTPTLIETLDAFKEGSTYEAAAEVIGGSRRLLYAWISKSKAGAPQFRFSYDGIDALYHEHIERLRMSRMWAPDPDWQITGEQFLRDENGELVPFVPDEEPPPAMADIENLREQAKQWQAKPKARADSPVTIGRATDNPNDPPERRTGAPPETTVAERERANPRAHQSINADLKPPEQRKSWAAPIDTYDPTGTAEPPTAGRMTMVTQRYNRGDSPTIHTGYLKVHDGRK